MSPMRSYWRFGGALVLVWMGQEPMGLGWFLFSFFLFFGVLVGSGEGRYDMLLEVHGFAMREIT